VETVEGGKEEVCDRREGIEPFYAQLVQSM
jgi:hypothetical protein